MAMLGKQSHDTASLSSATRFRYGAPQQRSEGHGFFASPTESEFSEHHYDSKPFVKTWDEERVAEWLRTINCSQYVEIFLVNNINGACLIELDRSSLREMGITKIGDQIRIASQIKKFRQNDMAKFGKRQSNRESLLSLDHVSFTSTSSMASSPKANRRGPTSLQEKRSSRLVELPAESIMAFGQSTGSRPSSPYIDEHRNRSQATYNSMSPPHRMETHPTSANTTNGKPPMSAASLSRAYGYQPRSASTPVETPQSAQSARFNLHVRGSPSLDQSGSQAAILPPDKPFIRVIYDTGRSSVVNIDGWKTIDDVMTKALRKGALNEGHGKNYCFWVLDGTEPNPHLSRKINDDEVRRICSDHSRSERGRLILRKLHMGEPDDEQIRTAASIAQQQSTNVIQPQKNVDKIRQLTGEPLPPISYPLSPASANRMETRYNATQQQRVLDLAKPTSRIIAARTRRIREVVGGRPPSELIASDLSTYFPEYEKDEIDKTLRQSIRRSRRISRAASRMSTHSNYSIASSLKDAPPLPAISDAWLNGQNQGKALRPLSVLRLGSTNHRDSFASSVLEPLDEESPLDNDSRKSFASAYSPVTPTSEVAVTDPEGVTTMKSYYNDDGGSSIANSSVSGDTEDGNDSLNKRLSRMVHEDSEESDEELSEYLENPSWDNVRYMKGDLIGKGSFGSVYLALHAVTGELMAVKQVEILGTDDAADAHQTERKKSMLTALKHEISLLRELKHPNIVQYLGSNSDDTHLNIFLEYVPGGSVASMLVNYGPLGETLISNLVRQILTGLAYLHSRDIIHRDIKGANILVDNKGSVKISDFGISKRVDVSQLSSSTSKDSAPTPGPAGKNLNRVSLQGSVFWMAPEVVRQTSYTLKADIWSLGCLIIEMFTGVHPHPNCTQLQAIFKIGSGAAAPTIPENVSKELRGFLERTFEIEWERRPDAKDLLGSRWVSGVGGGV